MPTKRPRLYIAQSYDLRAHTGVVVVVELRGHPSSSRYWEHVVQQPAPDAALVDFGLAAARGEQLRDFDLFLNAHVPPPTDELMREFGQLRLRWVSRRKNLIARKLAHALLRQRVPVRALPR